MGQIRLIIGVTALVVIGVSLIVVSAVVIPYAVRHLIEQNVMLKNNSEAFKTWLSPPAPIYIDFYFFNVTNSNEFTANWSVKPEVSQIGPYRYREVRHKTDVDFSDSEKVLRYRENKWYVFERNSSFGDESDVFTTVSLPILTIATQVRFENHLIQKLVKVAFRVFEQHLFEQRSVHELLWGFNLTLPSYITKFPFLVKFIDEIIRSHNGNSTTFGIYVGPTANGTDDGFYDIRTGTDDVSKLGNVKSWNGKTQLSYWTSSYCNMINGTDGTMWHPFVSEKERLYLFNSDLCRSLYITCDNCRKNLDVSSVSIPVYRFTAPADLFAAPDQNPDNQGFCTPDCLLSGVLNVSSCRNAPIVMSEPHFNQAAKEYQEAINGIFPDSKYQTSVDIEPNTGLLLNVARQVQINVYLRPLIALRETDNLNKSFVFPILWLKEHATIGASDAEKVNAEVLKPIYYSDVVTYLLYAVGGALLVIAIIWIVVNRVRARRQGLYELVARTDDDDDRLIDAGSG